MQVTLCAKLWQLATGGTVNPGPVFRWRKSSFSSCGVECVEVAFAGRGAVRDSKNPGGPVLRADLAALVSAARAGRLDR